MKRLERAENRARDYAKEHGNACMMGRRVRDLLQIIDELRKEIRLLKMIINPPICRNIKNIALLLPEQIPGHFAEDGIFEYDEIADGCKGSGGKEK